MKNIICDILIVGGGGSALRAALSAKEYDNNAKVYIAVKGKLGTTGTTANSCSDRMAFHATLPFTEPKGEDNWKYHADDIYQIGGRVSDYDLAEILAKKSNDAFEYLSALGVPFRVNDGRPIQFVTDGSEYARACYTGPNTAIDIENALVKKVKELNINIVENTMVIDLKVNNGKIIGALGVNEDNEKLNFISPSIVLCTGGAGEVYKSNVYPRGASGDGYALALNAGAELVNMEFIQFGLSSAKTKLACSGSFFRSIPRLINDKGEEFLKNYFPTFQDYSSMYNTFFEKGASWPVSSEHPSSIIDIAVFYETVKGGNVYLDYSKDPIDFNPNLLNEKNKKIYQSEQQLNISEKIIQTGPIGRLKTINPNAIMWLKNRGIDLINGDKIQIVPAAQHFQGGVKIRKQGETKVRGLFAAGECAGGQHGANRPGGNALLDCQVFGKISGESAAQYSLKEKENFLNTVNLDKLENNTDNELENGIENEKSLSAEEFTKELNLIMDRYASVVRTEHGLKILYKKISELKNRGIRRCKTNLIAYYEAVNMMITAEAIAIACMQRIESRGPHLYFENEGSYIPIHKNKKYENYFILEKQKYCINVSVDEPKGKK